jgi:hypothetical protein
MDPTADETKNAAQGAPPARQGQPSNGTDGSTSKSPRTYTEAEYQKAVSDALARAGRDAKSLAEREARLKAREESSRRQEAEYNAVKKDPAKLSAYELRKKALEEQESLKGEKERLARERADFEQDLTLAQKLKRSALIEEIAGEFRDGDPAELEKLCDSLGLSDPSRIRAAAAMKWDRLDPAEARSSRIRADSVQPTGERKTSMPNHPASFSGSPTQRKNKTRLR